MDRSTKVIIPSLENLTKPASVKMPVFSLSCTVMEWHIQYFVVFNIFMLTYKKTSYIFIFMAKTIDTYRYFTYPESAGQNQYAA